MHSTNNMDSGKPLVDFSKFFDGENLEQDDIVLWFSEYPRHPFVVPSLILSLLSDLGMHHLPHTEDFPITLMSTAQSTVAFRPHNYLSSGPSRQTVQQAELDLTSDRVVVDTYEKLTVCQAPVIVDSDYSDFQIDYTVSKMPKPTLCANC